MLWLVPLSASAGTVHTWVDEDGVTHFSDEPPESQQVDVTVLEVPENFPQPAAADEDYYSIVNQWQRAQEERMAREQLKLERAKLKAEQRRQSPDYAEIRYEPVPYVVAPARYPGFYDPGYGFNPRHKPVHYRYPYRQGYADYPKSTPHYFGQRGRGLHTSRARGYSPKFSVGIR